MGRGDHGDAKVLERVDWNHRGGALVGDKAEIGKSSCSLRQLLLLGKRGSVVVVDHDNGSTPLGRVKGKVLTPVDTRSELHYKTIL